MKFTILQQDFLPHLQSVARSVGVRSTLPVLDNILLSAEGPPAGSPREATPAPPDRGEPKVGEAGEAGKKLKIAATNLEIGVIKRLNADVQSPGEITVPAKTLVELIAGLGQNRMELTSENEVLTVESGKVKATINGISASEFPAIPLSSDQGISFPKEAFLTSAQVLFAAAVDEGRPVLTGVLTDVSEGKLDFVATDGFRLAHRRLKVPKDQAEFRSLIPRKTFEEVLRLISEEAVEEVKIATSQSQNQVVFSLGNTIVSSRLIEGQFPAWSKIIPEKIVSRAVIEKEELLKATKLAAIFSKNEANIVVLTTKKGVLKLESFTKEVGSQENEIEGEIEGEELKIAFNTKFILDAISNAPSLQIMIEFSGSLSAALIKPIGVEGLEYIVMPVRLS